MKARDSGRRFFYAGCRLVLVVITRIIFFLKVEGASHVPRRGGCIIASNHVGFLDPVLLAVASPRMLSFMAKEELFRGWFGVLIRVLNAFPVRRGSNDPRALRQALTLLNQGRVLIIFPEGTRSRDGDVGRGQPGIGMLAERAGVPVIPVYLDGALRAWPHRARMPRVFVPVRVRFGPAVAWPDTEGSQPERARYQAVSDAIIADIKKIKNSLS